MYSLHAGMRNSGDGVRIARAAPYICSVRFQRPLYSLSRTPYKLYAAGQPAPCCVKVPKRFPTARGGERTHGKPAWQHDTRMVRSSAVAACSPSASYLLAARPPARPLSVARTHLQRHTRPMRRVSLPCAAVHSGLDSRASRPHDDVTTPASVTRQTDAPSAHHSQSCRG